MKQLALDFLWNQEGNGDQPDDIASWFTEMRKNNPGKIFPYLVEASDKIERYYAISADEQDQELAILEAFDFKEGDNLKLPFNRGSGPQSAAIGPVIKRTYDPKKGPGPSEKIQKTTLESFNEIAATNKSWSNLFKEAYEVWTRPKLKIPSHGEPLEAKSGENAYSLAIKNIPEKKTVLFTIKDTQGNLPGENPEYIKYLQTTLAETKYATLAVPPKLDGTCSLCTAGPVTVYCNAITGAGINISNVDRAGAFPGITEENAFLAYPLCVDCADLLYIYKNYVAPLFIEYIAGDKALIIPRTQAVGKVRHRFFKEVEKLVKSDSKGTGIEAHEDRLMRLLGEENVITSMDIIWADFGQKIENLKGSITDILPSRLRKISKINDELRPFQNQSPIFPKYDLASFDLNLSFLQKLLYRPGGKKTKSLNESQRMFQLRCQLTKAIYHGNKLQRSRFWDEMFTTAKCYLNEASSDENYSWGLFKEGYSEKKQKSFWTLAGWIKHLARFLHYLTCMEVFDMPNKIYTPKSELLKPFFGSESGIDSNQKAFAFILGAVYGKLLQVQSAKGFNIGANALTWLKRLTLTGKDLPELYVKVREKLLAYETESSSAVREVLHELGTLGVQIGDSFNLNQVSTCYFLLLGQSLSTTILPSTSKTDSVKKS